MVMSSGYRLCGPRAARRYLILVNMVIAVAGLLYIAIGAVSLAHGKAFRFAVDEYCQIECGKIGCSDFYCSGHLPSCDCQKGRTMLPAYFYAPASGLIAVGVFSLFTPILGCVAAIRHQAKMLCMYILLASFVLILQFAFGVAAASVAHMDRVPQNMMVVFSDEFFRDFDWLYLKDFMPPACYAAKTHTRQHMHNASIAGLQELSAEAQSLLEGTPMSLTVDGDGASIEIVTHHPACWWNNSCTSSSINGIPSFCCQADGSGKCDTRGKKGEVCSSTHSCVSGFLKGVAEPVAVTALLTLVLEICAVVWACIVRRQTKPGGIFAPDVNTL